VFSLHGPPTGRLSSDLHIKATEHTCILRHMRYKIKRRGDMHLESSAVGSEGNRQGDSRNLLVSYSGQNKGALGSLKGSVSKNKAEKRFRKSLDIKHFHQEHICVCAQKHTQYI
jgi:predicted RNA-binding protein Jag